MKKLLFALFALFELSVFAQSYPTTINSNTRFKAILRADKRIISENDSVVMFKDTASATKQGVVSNYLYNKIMSGGGGETLGNPSISGMLLKSTTAGVRSWGYPSYVRNCNLTDTFSVLRTVPSGKIGNYTRSVTGIYSSIDSVLSGGYVGRVGANSGGYIGFVGANYLGGNVGFVGTNSNGNVGFVGANYSGGYVGHVNTNNSGGNVWFVDTNNSGNVGYVGENSNGNVGFVGTNKSGGYVGHVNTNNSGGNVWFVDRNYSGNVGFVGTNYSGGYVNLINSNSGICNTVKNAKSTTSGAHTIISAQVYYDNIQKWYRDSIGLSHGEIPSATGFDTTVNLSVNLTADVWQKVTNSTNNLWSLSNTASYMTFSADTIINTYAGKYEYVFSLSANGKDGATYEYRVMKKTGTTVSVIRKIKITGGGINTERIINCAPLLAAGDKVWLEIRFIGSPTGSPISIFGSYFTAKAVYLSL